MDTVRVGKVKEKDGEFIVPVYINGKANKKESYFTDDKKDAEEMRKTMINDFKNSDEYEYESSGDKEEKSDEKKSKKSSKKYDDEEDYEDMGDDEEDLEDEKLPPIKKNMFKESILHLSGIIE
jgi:hypothetical protein